MGKGLPLKKEARDESSFFRCEDKECDHVFGELVARSEDTGTSTCPRCGGRSSKIVSAPNGLHASYHDGVDRGDDYKKLKEAAKIERKMYDLPPAKRSEHASEIKKLKKSNK